MKNSRFSLIVFLMLFYSALLSQDFFNTNPIPVPLNTGPMTAGNISFGLEKINTDLLDIAVTNWEDNNRKGQWNLNNYNGGFLSSISFNPLDLGLLMDNLFVKLRSSSSVKDLIICRDNGLQVHWNDNGGITEMKQNFSGGSNWTFFETGSFNSGDNSEDILVSNGTERLYYFINTNTGYLSYNSLNNFVDLPYQVNQFKIRQLNEKCEGYIQNDATDRSDIIFFRNNSSINGRIYAYLNNGANGFNSTEFANFETGKKRILGLEVADLDGDGYNDIIVICGGETCPTNFYARAYRNLGGQIIYNEPFWSFETSEEAWCEEPFKINAVDLNKDGLNDLVIAWKYNGPPPQYDKYIRIMVFINRYNNALWFTSSPQQDITYIPEGQCNITKITAADIYGGQNVDGGGIALLMSYVVNPNPLGKDKELYVKVFNALDELKQTNPPPPILQRCITEINGVYHPKIHLNNRGERDFNFYRIFKHKWGQNEVYFDQGEDDYIDISECIDLSGGDMPDWNCQYYAKEVDKANRLSIASDPAYYTVGCIPVCDGCAGDNPTLNHNFNQKNNNIPEKLNLSQNYPNPFNPLTTIQFALPKDSKVKLTIYNSIGQQIEVLTNQYYSAGSYTVKFDGAKFPSGIYFYRIEVIDPLGRTGDYTETKKMILLK